MTKASQLLQNIYECNFSKKDKVNKAYLKTLSKRPDWSKLNIRTWLYCKDNLTKCFQPQFHQEKCLTSKQILIKTVRLRLPQGFIDLNLDPLLKNPSISYE